MVEQVRTRRRSPPPISVKVISLVFTYSPMILVVLHTVINIAQVVFSDQRAYNSVALRNVKRHFTAKTAREQRARNLYNVSNIPLIVIKSNILIYSDLDRKIIFCTSIQHNWILCSSLLNLRGIFSSGYICMLATLLEPG